MTWVTKVKSETKCEEVRGKAVQDEVNLPKLWQKKIKWTEAELNSWKVSVSTIWKRRKLRVKQIPALQFLKLFIPSSKVET